jgi:hypothetical protein
MGAAVNVKTAREVRSEAPPAGRLLGNSALKGVELGWCWISDLKLSGRGRGVDGSFAICGAGNY